MLNEIGQNNLIVGIIQQSIKDYKNSLRYMVRKGQIDEHFNLTDESYSYSEPYKIVCECEVFFNSEWFKYLTGTTAGEQIIERVRKEVVG